MAASVTALGGILGSDGDANDVGTALLGAPGGPGSPRSTGGESSHSPSRRPRPPFDEITSGRPRYGPRRAAALAAARTLARAVWNHWDKALVVALLATLVGVMASQGGPSTLTSLLAWFQKRSGWGGWGAFLGVYTACVALLLPAVWLVLGAGFVFGFWRGLLAVWVGGAIGQAAAFLLARYLLAGCVSGALVGRGRSRSVWRALDRAMAAEGWKLLALLRLCPLVPYNLLNIAAAATSLPFWAFALTSAIAIGPECALFTYTGSIAESVTEVVSGGAGHHTGPGRWVGFGLTAAAAAGTSVLATIFVRRAIARADALAAAEAEAEAEAGGAGGLDPLDPEGVFDPPPLEWAALVHAASTGRVTALLRRGGVREAGFRVRAPAAALIPTSFHQKGDLAGLARGVLSSTPPPVLAFDQRAADPLPLTTGATFTAAWRIEGGREDEDAGEGMGALLEALSPYTGLGPAGWAARAAGARTLTLLELRACPLAGSPPASLPQATPGLWGCRSWVALPPPPRAGEAAGGRPPPPAFALDLGRPALQAGAWERAAAGVRGVLGRAPRGVTVTEVDLLGGL